MEVFNIFFNYRLRREFDYNINVEVELITIVILCLWAYIEFRFLNEMRNGNDEEELYRILDFNRKCWRLYIN